jgi:hypothetical protein
MPNLFTSSSNLSAIAERSVVKGGDAQPRSPAVTGRMFYIGE